MVIEAAIGFGDCQSGLGARRSLHGKLLKMGWVNGINLIEARIRNWHSDSVPVNMG